MMFPPRRREQMTAEEQRQQILKQNREQRDINTLNEQHRAAAHVKEVEKLQRNLAFTKEVEERIAAKKKEVQVKKEVSSRDDAFSGMADVERTLVRLGLDAGSASIISATAASSAAPTTSATANQQQKKAPVVSLPALIHAETMKGSVLGGQSKKDIVSDSTVGQEEQKRRARQKAQANDEKLDVIRQRKEEDEQHMRDRIKRQYILDVEANKAAAELAEREERNALLLRARNLFSTVRDKTFEKMKYQANAEVERMMTERVVQAQALLFQNRGMAEEELVIETARERRRMEMEKFDAERQEARQREEAENEVRSREDHAFAHALVTGVVNIACDIIVHNEEIMVQSHAGTPHDPVTVSEWRGLCDAYLGPEAVANEEKLYIDALIEAEKGEIQAEEEGSMPTSPLLKNGGAAGAGAGGAGGSDSKRGAAQDALVAFGRRQSQAPENPYCCIARVTVMNDCPGLSGRTKTITADEKTQFRAATVIDHALTKKIEHEMQEVSWRDAQVTLGMLRNVLEENTDSKQEMQFLPTAGISEDEPPCAILLAGAHFTADEQQSAKVSEQITAFNNNNNNNNKNVHNQDENAGSPPMRMVELNRSKMTGQDVLEFAVSELMEWSEAKQEFSALASQFVASEDALAAQQSAGKSFYRSRKQAGADGDKREAAATAAAGGGNQQQKSQSAQQQAAQGGSSNKAGGGGSPGGAGAGGGTTNSGSTTGRSTGRKGAKGKALVDQSASSLLPTVPEKPKQPDFLSFDEAVAVAMGFELIARRRHRRLCEEYREAVDAQAEAAMVDFMVVHEEEEKKRFLRGALGKHSKADQDAAARAAEERLEQRRLEAREEAMRTIPSVPHRPWTLYIVTGCAKFDAFESLADALSKYQQTQQQQQQQQAATAVTTVSTSSLSTPRPVPATDADFSTIPALSTRDIVPPHTQVPSNALRIVHCSPNDITVRTARAVACLNSARQGAQTSTTVSDIFRFVLAEIEEERESFKRVVLLPPFGPAGAVHGELEIGDVDDLPADITAALSPSLADGKSNSSSSSRNEVDDDEEEAARNDDEENYDDGHQHHRRHHRKSCSCSWFRCAPAHFPAPTEETKSFSQRLGAIVGRDTPVGDDAQAVLLCDFVGGFRGLRDAEIVAFRSFSQAADSVTKAVTAQWKNLSVDALAAFGPMFDDDQQQWGGGGSSSPGNSRLPPPLLRRKSAAPPGTSSSTVSGGGGGGSSSTGRARSPLNNKNMMMMPFNNTAKDQAELVRHRLWQWYDSHKSSVIASVAEQLVAIGAGIKDMSILYVRAACHCLRALLWAVVHQQQDDDGGDNSNDGFAPAGGGGAGREGEGDDPSSSSSSFGSCPLSMWTSVTDEFQKEVAAHFVNGNNNNSEQQQQQQQQHSSSFMHSAGHPRAPFASIIPLCRKTVETYAGVLISEMRQLPCVPADVAETLVTETPEKWAKFVHKFFDSIIGPRIEFLEQCREALANSARKWIIYSAERYRAAVQNPNVIRAAVNDVRRVSDQLNKNNSSSVGDASQQHQPSPPRDRNMMAASSSSSSAVFVARGGGSRRRSSAHPQVFAVPNTMEPEFTAATQSMPRPANATVLLALEDIMRVSGGKEANKNNSKNNNNNSNNNNSNANTNATTTTTTPTKHATKSADQREIEDITRVVETQVFRDDSTSSTTSAAASPDIKLSGIQLRFLLLQFFMATRGERTSTGGEAHLRRPNTLWTFVKESAFVHAMLGAQMSTLGRVYHITNPIEAENMQQQQQQVRQRRNKLVLPTCDPSAFEIFVPALRWWGRKEAIQDAIVCVRKGIPSTATAFGGAYVPPPPPGSGGNNATGGALRKKQRARLPVPMLPIVQPKFDTKPNTPQSSSASSIAGGDDNDSAAAAAAADGDADGDAEEWQRGAAAAQLESNSHSYEVIGGGGGATGSGSNVFGNAPGGGESFLDRLDDLIGGAGGEDGSQAGDSWFGTTMQSESAAQHYASKPSTAASQQQRVVASAGGDSATPAAASRETPQQQQATKPPTPKPPRGADFLNSLHIESILSFHGTSRLKDEFLRLVSTARDKTTIADGDVSAADSASSSSSSAELPLELLFVSLVLGQRDRDRGGQIIKICTVTDCDAVVRKVVATSGSRRNNDNNYRTQQQKHQQPVSSSSSSPPSSSLFFEESVRNTHIHSVHELSSLPCFAQKSSISKSTGPSADMCTLWDILCGSEQSFTAPKLILRCWQPEAPIEALTYIPFVQLIPIIASDDAYLSRCERRFVIASALSNTRAELERSPSTFYERNPVSSSVWESKHTNTMELLSAEGIAGADIIMHDAAARAAAQIDTSTIQVEREAFDAAFADEPFERVIMDLVVRDRDVVTYHSHVCSLWGQEAWSRVNPRCMPTCVW